MCLSDHGIAADATKFVGNLAGGRSAFPHLLQRCDPFVGPAHLQSCISCLDASACKLGRLGLVAASWWIKPSPHRPKTSTRTPLS